MKDVIRYNPYTGSFTWLHSYEPAGTWSRKGYCHIRIDGVTYPAHRLAWYLSHGEWPSGIVDHIDRNPANNRLDNLRVVSPTGNMLNLPPDNSRTGLPKGISKIGEKYRVRLTLLGKPVLFGRYKTLEEAEEVLARARQKQWELAEKPAEPVDLVALGLHVDLDDLGLL